MHKKNTGRTQRLCARGSMVLSAVLLTCTAAFAQYPLETLIFTHDPTYTDMDNVKNYSMEAISADESVMAGTLWTTNTLWPCGYAFPHFVRNANSCLPAAGADVYYYNSLYHDQRVADIELDDNNTGISYITVALRPWEGAISVVAGPPPACSLPQEMVITPVDRDVFKVMSVNNSNGSLNKELVVWDTHGSGTGGWGLYPIHSLFNKANNYLYVCGYVTTGNTLSDATEEGFYNVRPVYGSDKYAFVMAIDVTTNPMTVVASQYFDWTLGLPHPSGNGLDFDMAMRMEMIGSDLFVLGSASVQTGVNNTGNVRSGSMVMKLDPATLALSSPSDNYSYIAQGNGDGFGINEFAIGMYENSGDYFVVGNTMAQTLVTGEGENRQIGFQPKLTGMYISYLNSNYANYWAPGRVQFPGNKWALQTLATSTTPAMTATAPDIATRFVIAGLGTDNCNPDYPGSIGNVNPHLTEISLHVDHTNTPTTPFITTILTKKPVGNVNYYSNMFGTNNYVGYNNLGGGLSSIYWNPTYACRYNTSDVVQMNAPIDDPTLFWNTLGLKVFHAKEYNSLSGSWEISNVNSDATDQCSDYRCGLPFTTNTNEALPDPTMPAPALATNVPENTEVREVHSGGAGGCYIPVFKTSSTGKPILKQSVSNTVIAPNPATDEISVTLASDIAKDAKVQVVLHNMMGQVVGKLYEGSAAKLTTASKLHLPAVASGIYTVQVISNGKTVHQQKLAIQ